MDIYQWVGLGLAIIGGLFAAYKWMVARDDQARANINNAQDRSLMAHQERLDRHRDQINRLDDLIQLTRAEMNGNFARLDHIEKLEKSLDGKMDQIHKRLSGIARDLNQTIGTLQAGHDAEIKNLVEKIKDAITATR